MPARPSPVQVPSLLDLLRLAGSEARNAARSIASHCVAKRVELRETAKDESLVRNLVSKERERRMANDLNGLPLTYHEGVSDLDATRRMRYAGLLGTDMMLSQVSMGMSAPPVNRKSEHETLVKAVKHALHSGVNYFDTAPLYGHNRAGERLLGEGLRGVPREAYYVSTKVGRYAKPIPDAVLGGQRWVCENDYSGPATARSVEESLRQLNVDYVDIVWIHDPHYCTDFRKTVEVTLATLTDLKREGLIRYVGIAAYDITVLDMYLRMQRKMSNMGTGRETMIDVMQCAGRYNILDTSLTQTRTIPYRFFEYAINCSIGMVSAGPMALGLFSPTGPPSWHPASQEVKAAAHEIVEFCRSNEVDVTRVCMHFALAQTALSTHLIGLGTPEQVQNAVSCVADGMTEREAYCLNWSLGRLESLDVRWWKEKEAMWNEQGWLSDKADYAQHYSDSDMMTSGYAAPLNKSFNRMPMMWGVPESG